MAQCPVSQFCLSKSLSHHPESSASFHKGHFCYHFLRHTFDLPYSAAYVIRPAAGLSRVTKSSVMRCSPTPSLRSFWRLPCPGTKVIETLENFIRRHLVCTYHRKRKRDQEARFSAKCRLNKRELLVISHHKGRSGLVKALGSSQTGCWWTFSGRLGKPFRQIGALHTGQKLVELACFIHSSKQFSWNACPHLTDWINSPVVISSRQNALRT